jgi:hypothetical protein
MRGPNALTTSLKLSQYGRSGKFHVVGRLIVAGSFSAVITTRYTGSKKLKVNTISAE